MRLQIVRVLNGRIVAERIARPAALNVAVEPLIAAGKLLEGLDEPLFLPPFLSVHKNHPVDSFGGARVFYASGFGLSQSAYCSSLRSAVRSCSRALGTLRQM